MKKWAALTLAAGLVILLSACAADLGLPNVKIHLADNSANATDTAQRVIDWEIELRGAQKQTFTMQEAANLPVAELELDGQLYRGISLTDLLENVGAENMERLAVVGANNERMVFLQTELNPRILLCWSRNYKQLASLTLVTKTWGKTRTLVGVHTLVIAQKEAQ